MKISFIYCISASRRSGTNELRGVKGTIVEGAMIEEEMTIEAIEEKKIEMEEGEPDRELLRRVRDLHLCWNH